MSALLVVLKSFLRERRLFLSLGFLLASLTALAGMALLSVSGWFITATALAGLSSATALAFDVFAPSAGIRFLALFRTGARYGERLVNHDATLSVLAGMRETLFRAFATARASRSLLERPARVLFRLTLDVDALDGLYLRLLMPAGVALVVVLFAMLSFAFIDGTLALSIGLSLLIAGFGMAVAAGKVAEKPARLRAAALEAMRSRTIDLVSGATDLLMTGRLAARRHDVEAADAKLAEADDRLNRIETLVGFGLSALAPLAGGALLVALAFFVEKGVIGAPGAAFALLLGLAAAEPFGGLRRGAVEAGRILAAARRIAPRLGVAEPDRVANQPPDGLALRLENVSARYPAAPGMALSALSLSLKVGETVALIGASGAGKSTLMGLIAGEVEAEQGVVAHLPASLLTQKAELFADTLAGNLLLADPEASDDALWAALEAAGLKETAASLPQGLQTWLGESGSGLSGGERRRLALARLFLKKNALLLLDEPTEALDAETARDIMARLSAAKGARTLLIATHSIHEAAIADRLIVLDAGRIIGDFNRLSPEFEARVERLRGR